MTEANLKSAFAGESQANMKYTIYAAKAKEEGYPNVARLFTAIAYAEQVHAMNHYRILMAGDKSVNTSNNLQSGIDGEVFEIKEMYPAYRKVAESQGEKRAELSFTWAHEAEKIHANMYQEAKQAVDGGEDPDIGPIQICEVCGYTVEGDAPDRCPVCKAPKKRFKTF
jgi:rubrerythrin